MQFWIADIFLNITCKELHCKNWVDYKVKQALSTFKIVFSGDAFSM